MATQSAEADSNNDLLIIIPGPGIGHIVSIVELANTLLLRGRFSIAMLFISPLAEHDIDKYRQKLAGLNSSVNLINIPKVDMTSLFSGAEKLFETILALYIGAHKADVSIAVQKLMRSVQFDSVQFIIDMTCSSMIDVANAFDAKSYIYCPSNAAFFGLLEFMLTGVCIDSSSTSNWDIPAYSHPVPESVLPSFLFSEEANAAVVEHSIMRYYEAKGIIVNTTLELEQYALTSFSNNGKTPPVYAVGPLLDLAEVERVPEEKQAERSRIVKWLSEQEKKSVIFLCFGSMGSFEADQVKEIAFALEMSGAKFLWALRKPPVKGEFTGPTDFSDPEEILPEGFMSRVGQRGLICGWAPQLEILAHKAIGGFVSHCGWNSILESLWFGVPIATWPLYAEQQVNAFYMVKDLNLAIDLSMDYRLGQADIVPAKVIESALIRLMDPDGEVRKRVEEMSVSIRRGIADGGSAFDAINRLIRDMLGK